MTQRTDIKTEHAAAPEAAHTHGDTKSFPKSVLLQCNPKWYNVYSQMRRPNLTIIWRASKLQMGPRRFPWLTGTHLDHAQGSNTGSCPNGSLQPVLLLCRASVLGNPKGYYRNSHNYSPLREFLTTETTAATAPRESGWPVYPFGERPDR